MAGTTFPRLSPFRSRNDQASGAILLLLAATFFGAWIPWWFQASFVLVRRSNTILVYGYIATRKLLPGRAVSFSEQNQIYAVTLSVDPFHSAAGSSLRFRERLSAHDPEGWFDRIVSTDVLRQHVSFQPWPDSGPKLSDGRGGKRKGGGSAERTFVVTFLHRRPLLDRLLIAVVGPPLGCDRILSCSSLYASFFLGIFWSLRLAPLLPDFPYRALLCAPAPRVSYVLYARTERRYLL